MTGDPWDVWHSTLGADAEASDPWYELVKQNLRVEDVSGRRVLEIGCGRGGFACWLAARGAPPAEVVGADYSAVALEKGRATASAMGLGSITWRQADIQEIDEADGAFDTVVSCETIEHVPRPDVAVRELARVLKPGGRLLLTTPNYLGTFGLYRVYLRLRGRRFSEVGQPINKFTTLPGALWWVTRAGLQVESVKGVGHYYFWPSRPPGRVRALDRTCLMPFALHSLIVARKPPTPRRAP